MLAVDVDGFKAFNDRYGHMLDDDVLRCVSSVLRGAVYRPEDVVARVGGEEFVIVLPGVTLANARTIAERVRRAIESAEVGRAEGCALHVTASIGVAYVGGASQVPMAEVYAAADRALYTAKNRGRNRVVCEVPFRAA